MTAGQHIQQKRATAESAMKLFGLASYRRSAVVIRVWVWACISCVQTRNVND